MKTELFLSNWLYVTKSSVLMKHLQLLFSSQALTSILPLPSLQLACARHRTVTATPSHLLRLHASIAVFSHFPSPSLTLPCSLPPALQVVS